jgi:hypothetical protein
MIIANGEIGVKVVGPKQIEVVVVIVIIDKDRDNERESLNS